MRLFSSCLLLLAAVIRPAGAGVETPPDDPSRIESLAHSARAAGAFAAANSNCAGASCDTVWIGHSPAGPGGAFLGVGVGGRWDFDTAIAGTDSTQGWRFHAMPIRFQLSRPIHERLDTARDYGNSINDGDQNLWDARLLAGRRFVRTGVSGAWHADGMAGVKRNLADAGEPPATPIAGARSAWCGLREAGNLHPDGFDPLTGNYRNGDLAIELGGSDQLPEFPGYGNLWDQMLYKDFAGSTGAGTVSFRVRTDLSNFVDAIAGGSGWLNPFPDPELFSNFVHNPADSLMVYVGSPTEIAYDTNRRWFSEVLDLSKPRAEIFSVSGVYPFVAADTAITRPYSGLEPGTIRVVFRVKTNRVRSDQTTGTATGYNSKQGAALVDQVSVDGGAAEGFETTAQVRARSSIPDLAAPGGPWATTGRPPHQYFHVENVLASGLAYADLCGGIGTPTRLCNLAGNVLLPGNHAHPGHAVPSGGQLMVENYLAAESPTIDLAVRTAGAGTKNAQGIDGATAARGRAVLQFDFYSGHAGLDESLFYRWGIRAHGPQFVSPVSGHRVWSGVLFSPDLYFNADPECFVDTWSLDGLGATLGAQDSLRIVVSAMSQGFRLGASNPGDTEGFYFDNLRLGLVRTPVGGLTGTIAHQLQDQFPWNEAVVAGDNAAFDTTAALLRSGLNLVPAGQLGVVPGDSIVVSSAFLGDGVTTGVRLDLVFRIDPGPGSYVVKGNRASALVDRDPAHPFYAAYRANNGPFGTPGGHGAATWNRHVWNSARMDSAELNLHPIVARGLGNPVAPGWMSTLHEADPKFALLGIDRNRCFLVVPEGAVDASNITCSGTPPAVYGAVPGTVKEGTKILPDGWFTPGTHIEYFVRRSTLEAPGTFVTLFDTNRVFPQDPGGLNDLDGDRWHSVDVLPDFWKSTRHGGAGLGCLLLVDAADRRGAERAYMGAADTTGYGRNNGAKKGWKGLGPGSDPNNPAGFVAANLGQAGINFDLFEVRAAEAMEAGRPGARLADNLGAIAAKGDRSGPSAAMLGAFYTHVLHFTADLTQGTLHDGFDEGENANDALLYDSWLTAATVSNRRGLWLSGDGIAEDALLNSDDGTILATFLGERFGASLLFPSYKAATGSAASTVGFLPLAFWAHPGRVYGLDHDCRLAPDVLFVEAIPGAAPAAQYQPIGGGQDFTASVYRPVGDGRQYRTLLDGFDLSHLRGHYANLAQIATTKGTDIGRLAWFDDALTSHFQICARRGPAIAVGDLPGADGRRFAAIDLGAAPNPAPAGSGVTLRFTLAEARDVTARIYDVAGREVARLSHRGVGGRNDVRWDAVLASGARAPAGVYFYRIDGVRFGSGSAPGKLILLGAAR